MNKDLKENATFIGGHRKSGTTMLLALFDGHPQLSVFPADSGFFYAYFPVYESPEYSNDDRINRIIDFSYGNLRKEIEKVDENGSFQFPYQDLISRFKEKASAGNFTSREMLKAMVSAYWETRGKDISGYRRWLEKTSSSEVYAGYIFKWFPDARFIHLVRDPRDNYASLKSGWEARYKERGGSDLNILLQSMIDRGRFGMELAEYNREKYGDDRYMVVKFEDVTTDPRKIMEQICQFLEIEYDDCLMRTSVCGLSWEGNNFDGLKFTGPSTANVNKWKKRITEEEAKVIEYHFRDVMKKFNYEPAFGLNECIDAAVEHYKWYNYSQKYRV